MAKDSPVHDQKFDIWYRRGIERNEIGSAIEDGRVFYGKQFDDLLRHELLEGGLECGKTLVSMALHVIKPVSILIDVIVAFKGVNIWGERVDKTERMLKAVGLGSQGILMGVDTFIRFRGTFREMMNLRRYNRSGRPGVKLIGANGLEKMHPPGAAMEPTVGKVAFR